MQPFQTLFRKGWDKKHHYVRESNPAGTVRFPHPDSHFPHGYVSNSSEIRQFLTLSHVIGYPFSASHSLIYSSAIPAEVMRSQILFCRVATISDECSIHPIFPAPLSKQTVIDNIQHKIQRKSIHQKKVVITPGKKQQ